MDYNARPHRTLAVEELLESEDITLLDWPPYSPDLNPIEHVWGALGRRSAACLHHPENTQQLKQMLIEEWALLPQEMLHQLVLTDEDWLCYYDPTIKQQSSEWKHPSSPTLKKAKTVKSAGKVMAIIFYNEGIVYQLAVKPSSTCPITYCLLRTGCFAAEHNVEILPHPPYSPDLTSGDFWLFPQLKKPLRGKRFASNKACVKVAEAVLK
ncbi:transposable element Tc1 transposase [Trichonephila clavipes]|nr:transposable element Tc1 transposase [Trichonephila clavipes]